MDIKELAKRVTSIEDIEAIKQMHHKYVLCLDNLEFARTLASKPDLYP
jgi:hypothetical protein